MDKKNKTIGELLKGPRTPEEDQQLREISENVRKSLAPIVEQTQKFAQNINIVLSHFAAQNEDLFKGLRTVALHQQQTQQKLFEPIIAASKLHRETIVRAGQEIAKVLEAYRDFHEPFAQRHLDDELSLPPFFDYFTLPEIAKLFENKDKSALQIYHDFFMEIDHTTALLEEWSKYEVYNKRIPIFKDAIEAHVAGKYTLSIPVLLSQIEGILSELFGIKKPGKIKTKLNEISKTQPADRLLPRPEVIANVLFEQVYRPTYDDIEQKYPNRNRILHGHNTRYYEDQLASTRCILILDILRAKEFDLRGVLKSGKAN